MSAIFLYKISVHLHLQSLDHTKFNHLRDCDSVLFIIMHFSNSLLALLSLVTPLLASPIRQDPSKSCLSDTKCGPIPGESLLYSDYDGKSSPFPANKTAPIPATSTGSVGEDDLLFQNLLSAEWAVYSFYQQGVEAFNESVFVDLGLPNTTYQRITEIRDNEAGHLRIFQDSISTASMKPGACKYDYGFTNAMDFLALQNIIEVSSMAFLTGLAQQAKALSTIGALVAIGETETRHEVSTSVLLDHCHFCLPCARSGRSSMSGDLILSQAPPTPHSPTQIRSSTSPFPTSSSPEVVLKRTLLSPTHRKSCHNWVTMPPLRLATLDRL